MGFKCSNPKQLGNEEYNKKLIIEPIIFIAYNATFTKNFVFL